MRFTGMHSGGRLATFRRNMLPPCLG